jgi:hypothetical protein
MLGPCPLIGLDRLLAKNGPDLSQYVTLQKPRSLLMLASAILVKNRRNFFPQNCQEMLGAGPLIGLDRFSAKNSPDLSQYATL